MLTKFVSFDSIAPLRSNRRLPYKYERLYREAFINLQENVNIFEYFHILMKIEVIMKGTIMFTGGGTGGHIYPNLALAREFSSLGYEVLYMGGACSMEERLAKENNIKFFSTKTVKLVRGLNSRAILNNISIPSTLLDGVNQAKNILKEVKPDVVFSKGGFASLPCVIAASRLNIHVFAHESDKTLGIANKIASMLGATILKAHPDTKFCGTFVGMPLRRELFNVSRAKAYRTLNISTSKPVLLVMGGSLGAQAINDEISNHLSALCAHFFVLHVTGKGKNSLLKNSSYKAYEYADDVGAFYGASDVVISRAGATSVFELSALQKKALFVPLPKGVSRGDQIDNAHLAKEYGANVLYQDENFSKDFVDAILDAYKNPPMTKITSDSNGKIVEIVCDRLRRGEICKDKKQSQNGSPSSYS